MPASWGVDEPDPDERRPTTVDSLGWSSKTMLLLDNKLQLGGDCPSGVEIAPLGGSDSGKRFQS